MVYHVESLLEIDECGIADGAGREKVVYNSGVGQGRVVTAKTSLSGM